MSPDDNSRSKFFTGTRAKDLLTAFDFGRSPGHVAVIMDGNGRWAAERGLPRIAGHRAGAKAVRELIGSSIELGVGYLTIYSFSSENWRRPEDEVSGLMRLFVEVLERELVNLERMNVRVCIIGDTAPLPDATKTAFEGCEARTAENTGMTLIVALNYGARTDIVRAARSLADDALSGLLPPADIDETALAARLSTAGIPDPDLLIRTSGEMRISNFLLWEIAYTELWVTSVLWPDFSRVDFLEAVVEFQKRQRRFGGA